MEVPEKQQILATIFAIIMVLSMISSGVSAGGPSVETVESGGDTPDLQWNIDTTSTDINVTTAPPGSVGAYRAELAGELEANGTEDTQVYFEWRENGTDTWQETDRQNISNGSFTTVISFLQPETEHEVRAVAETSNHTETGDVVRFTTGSDQGLEFIEVQSGFSVWPLFFESTIMEPAAADGNGMSTEVPDANIRVDSEELDAQLSVVQTQTANTRGGVSVYDSDETITIDFYTGGTFPVDRFEGGSADLVAVKTNLQDEEGLTQFTQVGDTIEGKQAEVIDTVDLGSDGVTFDYDLSAEGRGSGDYMFFVVNEDGMPITNGTVDSFNESDDARAVALSAAIVQDSESSVGIERPEFQPGETIEFEADAELENPEGEIQQAVLLYNEESGETALAEQSITGTVTDINNVSTDRVNLSTSIKAVEGPRRVEEGVSIMGRNISEQDEPPGSVVTAADLFDLLSGQIGDDIGSEGENVLNASMVAKADTGPETTFELETQENFTESGYSLIHVAEDESGQLSTSKTTIELTETVSPWFDVDIDEDETDLVVPQGGEISVTADIENQGTENDTQFVDLFVNDRRQFDDSTELTLTGGENETVTLTGSAPDTTGEIPVDVVSDNSSDTISVNVVDDPFFEVRINEDDSTLDVVEGETAVVNTTIENTVNIDATEPKTVNLTVGGEVVDQRSIDLDGEEATTVDFEWNTNDGDAGEVEAVVDSGDDSASTNVTVREPAFFDVTNLDPASLTVENGSQVDVSADITNTGGVNVTQDVELRFNETTVATQNVTLDPDESTTVTFADVPITETGEITHGIYTDDANATGTLTVVEEFATSIDVSLAGPTPAREQTSATYDISANVTNDAGEETLENITVDFGADSVDLSNVAAGDVTVQVAGTPRSADIVDQGDTLRLDLSEPIQVGSNVSAGDDINVTVNDVVNPAGGTYELEVSLLEADSRFATDSVEYTTETAADAVAAIEAEPTDPDVNVTEVEFNASASQGAGDLQYEWDFTGDGVIDETTQDPVVNHTYTVSSLGEYEASVRIVDELNENDTASVTIDVGDTIPPTAALEGPGTVPIETEFELNASGSTDNHRIEEYAWEIVDNETDETVFTDTTPGATLTTTVDEPGNYTASVTVSDESGNANTTSVDLVVEDLPNLVGDVDTPSRQRLQDGVNVTANVSNFGNQPAETAFDWTFTATGSPKGNDTSKTFQRNGTIEPNFEPGAVETVSDGFESEFQTWAEENQIVGEVTFEIAADPADAVDETITQDNNDTATTRVTYVELDTEAAVRPTVVAGSNVTLRSFVRNLGTATNDATSGTIAVENESGDVVRNTSTTVQPIVPGGRQKNATTEDFEEGDYTLNVSVSDEDLVFNGSLNASAAFTVEPYNLSINEPATRVPNEVRRGENFTAGLAYETNARDDVNVSINLPDGLKLASGQSENRTVDGQADRVNFVRWTVVAANASTNHEVGFDVSDTRDRVDETDSYSENVTVPVNWVSVSNTSAAAISDENEAVNTTSFVWNQTTDEQNLTISAQAGSNGRTLQGLEYLVRYPYGCVEQTTSAFLGALNTQQYYEDRDKYNISADQYERINGSIEEGVNRLQPDGVRGQRDDGGWDMWGRSYSDSDTFYSTYALYGVSQVENDETYSNKSTISNDLNNTDFDAAVTWLKGDQNDDGSFNARYYIRNDAAMTGFTIVSLNETSKHDRVSDSTRDNITEIYANASEYLVDAQEADGSWSDGDDRATGLAVWGLQIAMEEKAYTETANVSEDEMRGAIDNGTAYLLENQLESGRWDTADSPYWNARGEYSRYTGYVMLALDSVNASNLDSVNGTAVENATDDGAEYLTTVYEQDGSWGYPRSTVIAIEALTQVTDAPADRTVRVKIANSSNPDDPVINETFTVSSTDNPEDKIEFTYGDETLDQLRNASDPVHTVTITDISGPNAGDGTVIVAVNNEQLVDGDELGGDDE